MKFAAPLAAPLAAAALLLAPTAFADEDHDHDHVDIDLVVEGGVLQVEADMFATAAAFGGYIPLFEADLLREVAGIPLDNPTIDDPGIQIDPSPELADGTDLFANLVRLYEWDGSAWSNAVDEFLTMDTTSLTGGGVATASGSGASGSPVLAGNAPFADHEHHDFTLFSSDGTPEVGAYLLELFFSVSQAGVEDSGTVLVAFNNGLDEAVFEGTVDALAPVPLPAGVWLLGSAALGLVATSRRRARA